VTFPLPAFGSIDATRVGSKLYMGSAPHNPTIGAHGFHVVVLCAMEYQPDHRMFPGVQVVRVPLDDCQITVDIANRGLQAAAHVAACVRGGKRVLVTCAQGRNRSGLVAGLAMVLNGKPGEDAVRDIQLVRPHALTNTTYADFVKYYRNSARSTRAASA
jgi:protein-tyrosine phosphatase